MVEPIGNSNHSYGNYPDHPEDVHSFTKGLTDFTESYKAYINNPTQENKSNLKETYGLECQSRISAAKGDFPKNKQYQTALDNLDKAYNDTLNNPNDANLSKVQAAYQDVLAKVPY